MKRSSAVVLVLILAMVLGPLAGAFDKTLKVNVLDVAHLSSFNTVLVISYETRLSGRFSLVTGANIPISGLLGADVGVRYYLTSNAMKGLFAESRLITLGLVAPGGGIFLGGINPGVGYKLAFNSGITLYASVGFVTFLFGGVVTTEGGGGAFVAATAPDIKLGVGYSW